MKTKTKRTNHKRSNRHLEPLVIPQRPPDPFDNKWEVSVSECGEAVLIQGTQGMSAFERPWHSHGGYIYPPNFIERILGITFEGKIRKQKLRCERWCTKQNRIEECAKNAVSLSV